MSNEKKNPKKLTASVIKKENKALDGVFSHTLEINGEDYTVDIDAVFRKTEQLKVMEDIVNFYGAANENPELMQIASPYATLLMIKHFTSVDIPDEIDKAVEVLNGLIDLSLLEEILDLMPVNEVESMYHMIASTIDRMQKNIEETNEEMRLLAEKVENKELMKMLEEGGGSAIQ